MTDTVDILYMPIGYRFTFLLASFTKHILIHCKMTPRERLKLLEGLERLTDGYLIPEVLASIEARELLTFVLMASVPMLPPGHGHSPTTM